MDFRQGEPEERDNDPMKTSVPNLRYQLVVHLYQYHRAQHSCERHKQKNLPTKYDEKRMEMERNLVDCIVHHLPRRKRPKGGEDS